MQEGKKSNTHQPHTSLVLIICVQNWTVVKEQGRKAETGCSGSVISRPVCPSWLIVRILVTRSKEKEQWHYPLLLGQRDKCWCLLIITFLILWRKLVDSGQFGEQGSWDLKIGQYSVSSLSLGPQATLGQSWYKFSFMWVYHVLFSLSCPLTASLCQNLCGERIKGSCICFAKCDQLLGVLP